MASPTLNTNIPLFVIIPSTFQLRGPQHSSGLNEVDDNDSLSCHSSCRSLSHSESDVSSSSSSSDRWISCVSTNKNKNQHNSKSCNTTVVPPRAPKRLSSLIREDDDSSDEGEDAATNPLAMVRRTMDANKLSVRSSGPLPREQREERRKSLDCSPMLPRRSWNLPAGTLLLKNLKPPRLPTSSTTTRRDDAHNHHNHEANTITPRSDTGSTATMTTCETPPVPAHHQATICLFRDTRARARAAATPPKPKFPFLHFLP